MRIFVINLDRAPERLAHMKALLDSLRLAFTRVPAVDGKSLTADETNRWIDGEPKFYPLGPGEIGCFLSHRQCWQRVVREGLDHAVIFEDDIVIGTEPHAVLTSSDWIPADADVVKMDTARRKTFVDRRATAVVGSRSVTRLRGMHAGGAAYAVSQAGARKLVQLSEGFCDPVDQFLFNPVSHAFRHLVTYQLAPALCGQMGLLGLSSPADLASALAAERRQNRRTGWAKVRREVERPFEQAAGLVTGALANLRGQQRWSQIAYR